MSVSISSSSTPSSTSSKAVRKRFTKKELLHNLKILGPITNPLPATLPPSPPASRSASPVPEASSSAKRKRDQSGSPDLTSSSSSASKRIRTSPEVNTAVPQAPLTPPGDQPDDVKPFPVKRPRKGRKPDGGGYGYLHQKYMDQGKLFKRSSEARMHVYSRHDSPAFVQLLNKPPQGSPYAKYDRMMSKFEALDSVLCFAYAQWYMELWSNRHDLTWWQNSASFFEVSKRTHMEAFPNPGPREEALWGIHFLVDAYWRARFAWHYLRYNVENKVSSLLIEYQKSPAATKSSPSSDSSGRSNSVTLAGTLQPTPPSTGLSPANNQTNVPGTSSHSSTSRSPAVPLGQKSVPFSEELARNIQTGTKLHIQSGDSFLHASQRITLAVLHEHFPQTFARISKSTLRYNEECEIDFEDDESELFFPMAPTRGEGLGWVLALGRSMLREYGKDFGYQGIEKVARPEDIFRPNKQ